MPGKKPAKLGSSVKETQKTQLGQRVLLLSMGDPFVCPVCSRSQKNGMVSRFENDFYCSELCLGQAARVG